MELTALAQDFAVSDRDHDVLVLDDAIDGQGRDADELVALDFLIEGGLAGEMRVSREIPRDVVGQAGQDPGVIAAPEPLEVLLDNCRASYHGLRHGSSFAAHDSSHVTSEAAARSRQAGVTFPTPLPPISDPSSHPAAA